MRKVEQAIINAIESRKVGIMRLSKRDHVEVIQSENGLRCEVMLHGNLIAVIYYDRQRITVYDGGWQTVTTKSRLNALLSTFVGKRIYQKQFAWYFYDYTTRNDKTTDFESGMTFDITKPHWNGEKWTVTE